jgi:hypothetical protein
LLHPSALFDGLFQEGQRLRETSAEGVPISPECCRPGEDELHIAGLTDVHALFECSNGRWDIALTEEQQTDAEVRMAEGEGLLDRLRYLDRFCAACQTLNEFPEFRQAPGQVRPTEDRG